MACGMECRKILIVDNDSTPRSLLAQRLSEKNYLVSVACTGQEALDQLSNGLLPDVILLDLELPDFNGWKFLKIQKCNRAWTSIPTLVYSHTPDRLSPYKERFVPKSAKFEDLLRSLDRICAEKAAEHEETLEELISLDDLSGAQQLDFKLPSRSKKKAS